MRSIVPTDVPPYFWTISATSVGEGRPDRLTRPPGGQRAERAWGDVSSYGQARKTIVAFVPPKPNEFESATRIVIGRATRGTKSRSHCGSASTRVAVGGAIWSRIASAVKTASMPAAAPSKCPVIDFVDETASL